MRFDKLTTHFQGVLSDAQSLALARDHTHIEAAHLLSILFAEKSGAASSVLSQAGADLPKLQSAINSQLERLPTTKNSDGNVQPSSQLIGLLNLCDKKATQAGDAYIASERFLEIALADKNLQTIFTLAGADLSKAQLLLNQLRGSKTVDSPNAEQGRGALAKYTLDLTARARAGKLDPVIGRDDEIRRAMQILQRRTKNNPVLIGEPGVGKTAIVEGLAQRIANDEVPNTLKGKTLLVLDLASMLAGAKYRGEFEERLKNVLNELAEQSESTIIFIDELHTLVGAGKADGAMDASNMLKPALARGELHCLGATTLDEYRKYIEKDAALERRFQKVLVGEPSVEATIAILRGLQEKYELHHGVDITDPAIIAAAELSNRYITDRFLPDKAIDLIDEAAARIKIEIDSKPEVMDKLERRTIQLKIEREAVKKESDAASKKRLAALEAEINQLSKEYADLNDIWTAEKASVQGSQAIKEEIDALKAQLASLSRQGLFDKVAEIQYGKLPALELQLAQSNAAQSQAQQAKRKLLRTQVGVDEIAEVVARATGIPVSKMLEGEKGKLAQIESVLKNRVVGQDEAVGLVADAIRRSRAGLADPNKPYGSFLFSGPTGVGKTELTKALASFMFDSEAQLVRIDMSEYMEKHSVARLIGAPPGYVGYEEGGMLTENIRRKPYSVVLFDEIEKAHPDVFNVLLQVLDDGRLTDSQGRVVDFKNTIIIMTSNLGSAQIQSMAGEPPERVKGVVWQAIKGHFRPEFLNRVDEIVVFNSLGTAQIKGIVSIQLQRLAARLAHLGFGFKMTDAALEKLASAGYDAAFGARPLKRAIQQHIENPLSKWILAGNLAAGQTVTVDVGNDANAFSLRSD